MMQMPCRSTYQTFRSKKKVLRSIHQVIRRPFQAVRHQELFMKTFNQGLQEEEINLAKTLNYIICNESLFTEVFFMNFFAKECFHYQVQAKSLIPLIFSIKTRLFASSTTQKASSMRQKAWLMPLFASSMRLIR